MTTLNQKEVKENQETVDYACVMADTPLCLQVDAALEQDMLEMLLVVWFIRNTFVPIDCVPPEVLTLIPEYCQTDKELINLTFVCCGWREMFTTCALLWTFLDCMNLGQTSTYIQCFKGTPLEIYLQAHRDAYYHNNTLLLTLLHTNQLKSLTVFGFLEDIDIPKPIEHFSAPASLLKKLQLCILGDSLPVGSTIFDGNLPSLCELHFFGALTSLPWQNMANLTVFDSCVPQFQITSQDP